MHGPHRRSDPPHDARDGFSRFRRASGRALGVYLCVTAGAGAAMSWLVLRLLLTLAEDEYAGDVPELVTWCVTNRSLVPLSAVPALLVGLVLVRGRGHTFLLAALGTLFALIPVAVVVTCFLFLVSGLYEMPEL